MTKIKSTKRALLISGLALMMCVAMLIGSTFAWFTDSATFAGNIIKSGKLDVEMYWAEASEDPSNANWADASKNAIFDYEKWEPGFVQARHIKIANVGNLAFKYQMQIFANGIVSELADVIDVYYFDQAVATNRASFTDANKIGTLSNVINIGATNSLTKMINGELYAEDGRNEKIVTIAFKMQESAGNEYQNLSIGSDFSVRLYATQLTHENDSFDNTYDNEATFPAQEVPVAVVKSLTKTQINNVTVVGNPDAKLDTAYQFLPSEELKDIENTKYSNWHADYVVLADKKVPADSMMLAGYYKLFDDVMKLNGEWIGLTSSDDIAANTPIRLLRDGMNGISINYTEICQFGNDGIGFLCGAADLTGANAGTTLTVELRLYETEEPSAENGNSSNVETGKFITIGTFKYVFGGNYEEDELGAVYFYADNGEVVLTDAKNVEEPVYNVPSGVTTLGTGVFTGNSNVETVVLPNTITDLGRGFDTSSVKKVVLNEGLTTISPRAFKATTALEEVVFSSTVKELADDSFQKTEIKEITIPASVEKIGVQAFGASKVETVIIDGNVSIDNKAFRGCAALRNVYINGDDINFINTTGQGNCWFCNSESNNPNTSNITFYVKNNTVAAKIKTAMGAEANNTTVYVNDVIYQ